MCVLVLALLLLGEVGAAPLMVVDLMTGKPSVQTKIAVQTCAGLFNRDETVAGAAYTFMSSKDALWLEILEGVKSPPLTSISTFLSACFAHVATGRIRYNYTEQQLVVPNLVTLGAVLDAVPLEDEDAAAHGVPVVFDAVTKFAGFAALDGTRYMFDHYINETTAMAKMNPGLDVHQHPIDPPLTGSPNPGLIDFIVKEKIFNFFLNDGCIPRTKEHDMMDQIAGNNPWPKPVKVYGYDDTFPLFGGDIYEAETTCAKEHNMGQIASDGVNNLAFYSRKPRITKKQNVAPTEPFNASRTYMTFVLGDGDNVGYNKGQHYDWFEKRLSKCKKDPSNTGCFPLLWTTSPHLTHLAPEMLTWYYNQSYATGKDYFMLPPSGHLYAYPALMPANDQLLFAQKTEEDAILLDTCGTVDWEWFTSWEAAINEWYPRYSTKNIIRGIFPLNVPFFFPTGAFGREEFFKVIGGNTVVFRPRTWRGTTKTSIPFAAKDYLTNQEMADEINAYPAGTVSFIYLTSDGGASIDNFYDLVPLLHEHVRVVNHKALVDVALQSHEQQ